MLPFINSSYFDSLVQSFTNGLLIINTNGDLYVSNTAATNILGKDTLKMNGSHWKEVLSGIERWSDFEQFMESASRVDQADPPFQSSYTKENGRKLHLTFTTSRLVEYEKIFGIMILINDVTSIIDFHEREKKILSEKNALQSERFKSLENLSTAVAHQIRNPMMTIGGFANILLRKIAADSPQRDFLEGILEASKRLESVVKAVSNYTGLSIGTSTQCSANEIVATALARVRELREIQPEIEIESDVEPAAIMGDATLLSTAVEELITNALESLDGSSIGTIRIAGNKEGCSYRLSVSDSGKGIPSDIMPFITDPFFTTKAVGVGMGLCNVKRIVDEHGGELSFESSSAGTKATLELALCSS